ncbi:MAG: hypothetical protein HYT72_01930 [Candidatus Aenigmarchaeota archaeon]|nr:hypothetical protein [Candidatus Aenigmarchaeota archaeon]
MLNMSRQEPWQRQLTQRGFGTIQSYGRTETWYGRSGIPAEQLFKAARSRKRVRFEFCGECADDLKAYFRF